MTAEKGAAVGLLGGVGRGIDRRIAVGEAVGHEQIDHIGRGETLPGGGALAAGGDVVRHLESLALAREDQVTRAGLGRAGHLDIDEEVVGALGLVHVSDAQALRPFDADVAGGNAVAVDHEL